MSTPRPTYTPEDLLRRHRAIKRELLARPDKRVPKKIAVLGGSTTHTVVEMLDVTLLMNGIAAEFYESDYNQYYEAAVFDSPELKAFAPDIIYIHTTSANISEFPQVGMPLEAVNQLADSVIQKFELIWDKLKANYGATIIQNNFEYLPYRDLGNLDGLDPSGRNAFINRLNAKLADKIYPRAEILLSDIHYVAASVGLDVWHDAKHWYAYKYAMSHAAMPVLAHNIARLVVASTGKAKKCLILDLDNTMWGGVIGDDGVSGLRLGKDTPEGEAHQELQEYAQHLSQRGVVLAVASKNEHKIAKSGFDHPDSVLKFEDFGAFKANWGPKNMNIAEIALELNLGVDSFVFLDDNPAERALVGENLPTVAVPDIGPDVVTYLRHLDRGNYFEPVRLSKEDFQRKNFYSDNLKRNDFRADFADYGEFLKSLRMQAEIKPFADVYLERITQLINKTNQFNLTTKRFTRADVDRMTASESTITLYGRLADKFGDNGLVSVLVGEVYGDTVTIPLWVMSCRVLKRQLELAMFDALVAECLARHVRVIKGSYIPTERNALVSDHYQTLGFTEVSGETDAKGPRDYVFEVPSSYQNKNQYIEVIRGSH